MKYAALILTATALVTTSPAHAGKMQKAATACHGAMKSELSLQDPPTRFRLVSTKNGQPIKIKYKVYNGRKKQFAECQYKDGEIIALMLPDAVSREGS
ncbi:MAG: hypothetical protein AAF337_04895 [Pseudomonadota bacterium]